jgi:hypothetical protein
MARDGGLHERRPGGARGARGIELAAGMDQAEVADRGEHRGEGELAAQHARAEVVARDRDGLPRPERHVLEHATVLAQRELVIGTAVDVVEHHPGQAALRPPPQVIDVDHARRCQRPRGPDHRDAGTGVRRGRSARRAVSRRGWRLAVAVRVSGVHV